MEGKIAVLGDTDFVMPFSALGVDTFPVSEADAKITEAAEKIVAGKYALVVVAENIAPVAETVFTDYQGDSTPCVVVVPFTMESKGFATETLTKVLKLATGINILQNN